MDTKVRGRRRGAGQASAALALVALMLGAAGTAVLAASPSEVPGNNGTVKIHEGAGEPSAEVRNEPHVCTFHLHFFFADAADSGTWEIQEWSPGEKGTVVLTGTYMTDAGGEDRDPDAGVYELPDGHYKLFWDGDLDTDKHDKQKVFWVDCEEAAAATASPTPTPVVTPTPTPVVTPTPTPEGNVAPILGTPTPSPAGGVSPILGTPAPTGDVEGVVATPGTTLPPTDMADAPAATGSSLGMALMLLAAVLASASITLTMSRVRNRRP